MSRLESLIENLLKSQNYETVSVILDSLDVENTGNYFTDLVDIACLCRFVHTKIPSFAWFKKRLVNKIYEERGEAGQSLIKKIMN